MNNNMNKQPGEMRDGDRRHETDRKDPQERRDQTTAQGREQTGGESFDRSQGQSTGQAQTGQSQTGQSQTGSQTR